MTTLGWGREAQSFATSHENFKFREKRHSVCLGDHSSVVVSVVMVQERSYAIVLWEMATIVEDVVTVCNEWP